MPRRETEGQDDQLRHAPDAIPKDAIWLTDAYDCLVTLASAHPTRLPEFDPYWSEALRKSRLVEESIGHDPETFDKPLQQEWHLRKVINLFLRLEIEKKRIVACVRDPETGITLQLRSDEWIPDEWEDYVPPGIWSDYIDGDYEAPGPDGTLIGGALRPVFFIRTEFEAWLKEKFGTDAGSNRPPLSLNPREGGRVVDAVKQAVSALWGRRPVAGINVPLRNEEINKWLRENGRLHASDSTIKRALALMRADRS